MISRYARDLDLDDLNAHTYGVLLTPPGSRVLDVGTADGHPVVEVLRTRGCRIWGVEIDEAAARQAAPLCEQMVTGNVEDVDLQATFGEQRFDVILCLDVLEHLVNPARTLQRLTGLLATGGQVVLSLPNVSHAAVRLQLLGGHFTYTDTGLLDSTHLRFFDRDGVDRLLQEADCVAIERLAVYREPHETEIALDLDDIPPSVMDQVRADPDSRVFQWIVVTAPAAGITVEPADPEADDARGPVSGVATVLLQRLDRLELAGRQSADHIRALEDHLAAKNAHDANVNAVLSERAEQLSELNRVLRERSREFVEIHEQLRAATAALGVKDAYVAELTRDLEFATSPAQRSVRAGVRRLAVQAAAHPVVRRVGRHLPAEVKRRLRS